MRVTYQHFSQQVQINTLDVNLTLCAPGDKLMNLIRGLLKQQASFSVSANKTSYCPLGPLLSALQRIASQLAFVFIMLEASSHCTVGSIPMPNQAHGDFSQVTEVSDPPCHTPNTHTHIQRALFLFCVSNKLWLKFQELKEARPCESCGGPVCINIYMCVRLSHCYHKGQGGRAEDCCMFSPFKSSLKESIK